MKRPNVVLVMADDIGYGDIGVFGDGSTNTPCLDDLAREGLCLTQYYSAAPVCTPSRAGLLTGRYPHRTGAIDMREIRGLSRLALAERTIADYFKAAGYTTGLVGKWHLGSIGKEYHPNARGFDEFVGFRGGLSDFYDWRLYDNDEIRESDGRYLTDVFAEESVQFIRKHQSEPFFLHVAFNAPHIPIQAPEEEIRPFRETGKFNETVSTIYGMIHRMDKGIGTILDELKRLGLEEHTIVLFTSDHGPQFYGKGENDKTRYNANFRGHKSLVYEGGIHVPAIIRWPGEFSAGRRVDQFVHGTDWLSTLITAAGIEIPADLKLDGYNVLPLLRGEQGEVHDKRFWQWNKYTPLSFCNAAMRDGDWKLVRPAIKEAIQNIGDDYAKDREIEKNPEAFTDILREPEPYREIPEPLPPELYNLKEDPYEQVNLADRYPERVKLMLEELEAWFEDVEADRKHAHSLDR